MSQAILSTSDIRVNLGGHEILHGISLDFEPGRIYAIVGPNGCGKTTLLRTICGATKPSSGQVLLAGQPTCKLSSSKMARKLAVVWQGGHVTGDLTVQRLVCYGRYAHLPWWKLRSPKQERAVENAMKATSAWELASRRVDTLSGGERQRVWLAAALAQKPEILLLDEPTTYLDIAHQLDILELVTQLNQTSGITVVMVLHDLTQAARYCDHCIVMGDGRVLRQGAPDEALSWNAIAHDFSVDSWVTTDPHSERAVIVRRSRVSSCNLTVNAMHLSEELQRTHP